MSFAPLGERGQQALRVAEVVVVGCGALGSALANTLVRAGVGSLRIIDRDFVELDNLQRQALFDEHDVAANLPKAEAAARKLRRINSAVEVEPIVADLNPGNAEWLCRGADLILDGTDNIETRFLLKDVAVKHGLPWVYGACVASEGRVLPIVPHRTPCLRCVWDELPAPGELATCETAGILEPAVRMTASIAATAALKILAAGAQAVEPRLVSLDVWNGRFHVLDVGPLRDPAGCRCCGGREFEFLSGRQASSAATLCGRDSVQVLPRPGITVDLRSIARRLGSGTRPSFNEFLLRFRVEGLTVTLFADGRAIVQGTSDPARARTVYARYVGD